LILLLRYFFKLKVSTHPSLLILRNKSLELHSAYKKRIIIDQ
jgi:hypothetical protein